MSLIDEARINNDDILEVGGAEQEQGVPEPEKPQFKIGDIMPDLTFLMAETGEGSISDYIEHPLNPKGSKGLAQILRGTTGLLGSLNYAIIDIALGVIEYSKEGRMQHEPVNSAGE